MYKIIKIICVLLLMLKISCAYGLNFNDPTEPPDVDIQTTKASGSQLLRQLNLHEIVFKHNSKWAVINNTIVREGDMILNERVIEITPHGVKLKGEAGEIQLQLIDIKPVKEIPR